MEGGLMNATSTRVRRGLPDLVVGKNTILNTFPHPILVLDGEDSITYANPGAEQFFAMGATQLHRSQLGHLVHHGSPAMGLVREARKNTSVISEYGIDLGSPRLCARLVDATASPIVEAPAAEAPDAATD